MAAVAAAAVESNQDNLQLLQGLVALAVAETVLDHITPTEELEHQILAAVAAVLMHQAALVVQEL